MSKTKAMAFLGTGSDVGKSIVAAAVCRSLADRGVCVAPFKAQNMSNNSGITPEGLEMGRAQIVQAEAARVIPHVDMNPVLLKPTGETGSQVVLNGRVCENCTAADYHNNKGGYFHEACQAFDRLREQYEIVVMEGAGSCAEVNLMPWDIVNFPMAEYAKAHVVLVADIHRGGVFAQIVGTLACLPPEFRDMIQGFIINRFRGDISLFRDGVEWIEKETGKPVFGVVPWYTHFRIDAEDSVEIESCPSLADLDETLPAIAVVRLPHISNFTDFHALTRIQGIQTVFVEQVTDLTRFAAVIIPGSKNTRVDLSWLESRGWSRAIKAYASEGGHILGVCGGYQILGHFVDDPQGIEDRPGRTPGLELLPVETVLKAPKTTTLSCFSRQGCSGEGYEIHMGETTRLSGEGLFEVITRNGESCDDLDGCISEDGRMWGTYMHGLFDSSGIAGLWLKSIGIVDLPLMEENGKERDYQLLKEHFESHVDMERLLKGLDIE